MWADVAAAIQDGSCAEKSDTSVGLDAESVAEWMRQLPGIIVSDQPDETVAGMRAIVLDIQYAPSPGSTCTGERVVPLLASRPGAPDASVLGITEYQRLKLMLVDLTPDHTAAVYVAGPEVRFSDLVIAATPVIASFDLAPGA